MPSEDPNALVEEYMHLQEDLTKLIQGINRTNHETLLEGKKSLSEALVERDALLVKRNILAEAASQGSEKQNRYSRSEIKYVSTIHIEKFQKEADRLSKRFRELDTKIQAMNWTVEFIEA